MIRCSLLSNLSMDDEEKKSQFVNTLIELIMNDKIIEQNGYYYIVVYTGKNTINTMVLSLLLLLLLLLLLFLVYVKKKKERERNHKIKLKITRLRANDRSKKGKEVFIQL